VFLHGRPEARTNRRAPVFGEHTREILADVVGFSEAEIAALEAEGAVGGEPDTSDVILIPG
jgi:crotonobetainyl-CoA:carnitine CoA-transferase CaiB-like acyl-CoA transferase